MPAKKRPSTEGLLPNAVLMDTWPTLRIVEFIINEQRRAVDAAMEVAPDISRASEMAAECIRSGGRFIYVGAGTSGRLAMLDAVECFPTFGLTGEEIMAIIAGGRDAMLRSIEGSEDDTEDACKQMANINVCATDVVCGVAASGTTPFVLASLAEARARGAKTVFITCGVIPKDEKGNPVADVVIHLNTGAEVVSGSTRLKAGTSQKITLNTISTTLAILLHKTYGGLMVDVQATNAKLRKRAIWLVWLLTGRGDNSAKELLGKAKWHVKLAVVMHYSKTTAQYAEKILKKHDGDLRAIIGNVDYMKRSRA